MIKNGLSWINLNGNGGSGDGSGGVGTTDYNQLINKPIKTLTGSSQSMIKLWKLETGLFILNGYVQHTEELANEVKDLFVSITACVSNGKYVVSVYIPFWEGKYEYVLETSTSSTYTDYQMIKMLNQYEILGKDNEIEYIPTQDYHPSTKKYVDDILVNFEKELNEIGITKQNIANLKAENKRRDIIIQALLSQNSTKMVTIEEDERKISLDYSIDSGFGIINELEGNTLVNVCNIESANTPFETELTYLYSSTTYTIQFNSSSPCTGTITLGGRVLSNVAIVEGLNRITITTPETLTDGNFKMETSGSCIVSKIVVVNSVEDFGYFEGMKSTFEDTVGEEGYKAEVVIYNSPVRFGKGGRL